MKRRVLVIRNPAAGRSRPRESMSRALIETLRREGHEVKDVETRKTGDAAEWAEREGARWDFVVSAGGDGTANEVANGLIRGGHDACLVVAPLGTGNDYARLLGTPRLGDITSALATAVPTRVDTLEVIPLGRTAGNSRHGLLFCGCGLATALLESTTPTVKRMFGRRGAYPAGFLRALWSHQPRRIRIRSQSGEWETPAGTVFVAAKARYAGGGTLQLAPGARLDDGLLHGLFLGSASRGSILGHFLRLSRGVHEGHPDLRCFTGTWVEVEADPPMALALDGEVTGMSPVRIQVCRESLRVLSLGPRSAR
ncbi:MAG: diacylglycerol kinase family lipid kinase [Verrucomicrobiales bacterium]|nr:diacylglycerol kinase family lipid kinase [Verrucomicrobiales bacterium]